MLHWLPSLVMFAEHTPLGCLGDRDAHFRNWRGCSRCDGDWRHPPCRYGRNPRRRLHTRPHWTWPMWPPPTPSRA